MGKYIQFGPAFREALVEEKTVFLPPACAGLDGRTLLFITDVHASRAFPGPAQERLLRQAAALEPDMILLGGDYAESARWQGAFFARLKNLRPPLGMFAVAGNNDLECFSGNLEALRRVAREAGVELLTNQVARVRAEGATICVGGLNEMKYSGPFVGVRFAARDERALRIVLAHYPHAAGRQMGKPGPAPHFCLTGHTHGGQWRLGRLTPYSLGVERRVRGSSLPAVSGWKEVRGVPLLVSPGVGTSRVPLRIGVPPAIHLLRLKKGDGQKVIEW